MGERIPQISDRRLEGEDNILLLSFSSFLIFYKINVIIFIENQRRGEYQMKKWYVTYTILTMVEGEDFDEARVAAEKFAEDEGFYHLINNIEVEEVEN